MKITVSQLRRIIRESLISEVAIMEPPADGYVRVDGDQRSMTIYIVDPTKNKAHWPGFMNLLRVQMQDGAVWEIQNVAASKGYGPLLYDVAMELVGPGDYIGDNGLMCDRTSVSDEARGVWRYYFERRNDVEKELLPEDWFSLGKLGDRPDYLRHYYFKISTPVVDNLRSKGLIRSDDYSF